jgi:hypothetical protein
MISAIALVKKGVAFHAEYGTIRTVGALAKFLGNAVNDRCQNIDEILSDDRGEGYPLRTRWNAARLGMSADSYLFIGLDTTAPDHYICSNDPVTDINQDHILQVHDKYVFQQMTQPHVEALPTLYGVIENGTFVPTIDSQLGLDEVLEQSEGVVFKPTRGGKGVGIHVVRSTDDGLEVRLNGTKSTGQTISETIARLDEYLVFEFILQHEYAAAIFPEATNTLRVHSIINPETGEAEILRPVHRFGSSASKPTDNWSQGGYIAPIDETTGTIQELVVVEGNTRSRLKRHPETNSRVAGIAVPYWESVRELVCQAAEVHRQAPLVGWDVIVTETGPVLIEANARPDEVLLQLEEGLLADSRARQQLDGAL